MRKDPEVTRAYRKNPEDEKFLGRLNDILAPYEEESYGEFPEDYPTIHVFGVPRSGTTLLSQAIAARLDIGYVNNLVAAFWRAPVFGIRLSRKLLGNVRPSSFESDFGRTQGLTEPHEFGYFWSSLLGYEEMLEPVQDSDRKIDWLRLRYILVNMCHAFAKPVLFKNFVIAFYMPEMLKILPKTCFVRVRRDPLENALSLLAMREGFLGSKEKWVSIKPQAYEQLKDEPYWVQVAGQVYHLERAMDAQVSRSGGRNLIDIGLDDFLAEPGDHITKVRGLLANNKAEVADIETVQLRFEPTRERLLAHPDRNKVEKALGQFY